MKQFPTTTRSRVHSVSIVNDAPKLVIACYAPGQTQRSLLSVWRTVTVKQSVFSLRVNFRQFEVCDLFRIHVHAVNVDD